MGRLPTGVKPIYTAQIIIMSPPELAGELRAWAEASERHASDLQREVLEAGWAVVKPQLEAGTPVKRRPTRASLAAWIKRVDRAQRPTKAARAASTAARRLAVARSGDADGQSA